MLWSLGPKWEGLCDCRIYPASFFPVVLEPLFIIYSFQQKKSWEKDCSSSISSPFWPYFLFSMHSNSAFAFCWSLHVGALHLIAWPSMSLRAFPEQFQLIYSRETYFKWFFLNTLLCTHQHVSSYCAWFVWCPLWELFPIPCTSPSPACMATFHQSLQPLSSAATAYISSVIPLMWYHQLFNLWELSLII